MNETGSGSSRPRGRHLLPPETPSGTAVAGQDVDLARAHGQGNGLRVHGLYFAVVSLIALALIIGAVVLATATM